MRTELSVALTLLKSTRNLNDFPKHFLAILASSDVTLSMKETLLVRYASLIRYEDAGHQIALEQFTIFLCMNIFRDSPISVIENIYKNLRSHFPDYMGDIVKPLWLIDYISAKQISMKMEELFKRGSYQAIISSWAKDYHAISELPKLRFKEQLDQMASHAYYMAHDTTALQVINTVTHHTHSLLGLVPGLNWLSSRRPRLVRTQRESTLSSFSSCIETICHPTQEHLELLFYLYMGANDFLRADIALHMDELISTHQRDRSFLLKFLRMTSPQPLGTSCFSSIHFPNLLKQLSIKANELLLNATLLLCHDEEREYFQKTYYASKSATETITTISLKFTHDTSAVTEWFAYLLCMGNFQYFDNLIIYVETPTHRNKLLLLTLLESPKLTISYHHFIDIFPSCFTPPLCRFETLGGDSVQGKMICESFMRGFPSINMQRNNPTNAYIENTLTHLSYFTSANPHQKVILTFSQNTQQLSNILFEIELSKHSATPTPKSLASPTQRQYALSYFLMIYSLHWRDILSHPDINKTCKQRPVAVPLTALNDREICRLIHAHHHLHLLVFREVNENKTYAFDVIFSKEENSPVTIKPGIFISSAEELQHARSMFNMQGNEPVSHPYLPSSLDSFSDDLSDSLELEESHYLSLNQ